MHETYTVKNLNLVGHPKFNLEICIIKYFISVASVLTMLHPHWTLILTTQSRTQCIRYTQEAPGAYEESITIITLYELRNHQDLSQSRTLSLQQMVHLHSVLHGNNLLNVLCSYFRFIEE